MCNRSSRPQEFRAGARCRSMGGPSCQCALQIEAPLGFPVPDRDHAHGNRSARFLTDRLPLFAIARSSVLAGLPPVLLHVTCATTPAYGIGDLGPAAFAGDDRLHGWVGRQREDNRSCAGDAEETVGDPVESTPGAH